MEWPETPLPSEEDLLKTRWITVMESEDAGCGTFIRKNRATRAQNAIHGVDDPFSITAQEAFDFSRLIALDSIIRDRDFMDLVCIVGTYHRRQGILCHRIVLAQFSPRIRRELLAVNHDYQVPYQHNLPWNITADSFFSVLDWIYRCIGPNPNQSFQELAALYVTTQYLEMDDLKDRILKEFKDHIRCLNNLYLTASAEDVQNGKFKEITHKLVTAMGKESFKEAVSIRGGVKQQLFADAEELFQ
ncbi:hypothetical protein H072_205 [Dactylellina haptotyla CBS 200.50]|uniref:BTB domain-containing protein n=1 Tax=Dactylellina haptotyla (strain CBS 200.50) TaxID=1284197 RepID=S8AY41_DACHA|nr:hypothetical protein H072_205 [Dactylellina haptotyla CBS 200.50]